MLLIFRIDLLFLAFLLFPMSISTALAQPAFGRFSGEA